MNIDKLDHVALVSSDAKTSLQWYQQVFEMEWIFQGQWDNNPYFLKKGDAYIAIFQEGASKSNSLVEGQKIDHFAFRANTKKDYDSVKEAMTAKGIGYEEQDHEISHSIYIQDPDDITVEVTTYDI